VSEGAGAAVGSGAPTAAPSVRARTTPALPPAVSASEAERRQMTVMFCDLVGSTRLSNELDPEDLRDMIKRFQDACAAEIARFDGFIARYMGDGMLVYFGYPRAHEDSAERAVRAGIAITQAVSQLQGLSARASVRVGIASGRVVVGDIIGEGASEERAVVGETPNLAARLQGLAEPDTVVISSRTRRLVGSVFELEDLGRHALKGFDSEVQAWRALAENTARHESDVSAEAEPPLIGRTFELALLKDRWRGTGRGEARIVTLVGDAGCGKSRLLSSFLEHVNADTDQATSVRYYCARHHESTALFPVIDLISRRVGLDLRDTAEARREKITTWVGEWSSNVPRDSLALQTLLGVADDDSAKTPEEHREDMLRSLWQGFGARLHGDPLLIVFEDIQWADPTTLRFIEGLIQRSASASLMIVLTHRPEFEPPWGHRGGATTLNIGKLGPDESRDLVLDRLGERALPSKVVDTILSRSDGVPAYLTELTRAVVGSLDSRDPDASLESIEVPETLQGSFAAQLDQLGEAREIAQVAAAIGRTFSRDLLRWAWDGDPTRVTSGMERLLSAGLVVADADVASASYSFRYALLADVAYESLLKSTQRALHDRIATILLEELPDAADADEVSVARHLTRAHRHREASQWWVRAGERAAGRAAVEESIAHFRSAVATLEPEVNVEDPEDCERLARVQIELALKLRFVREFDEAFDLLARAEALANRHGLGAIVSHVYFSRGNLYFQLSEPEKCAESHQRALDEARRAGSTLAEVRALGGLADATMVNSGIVAAAPLFVRCVELAEEHGFAKIAAANAGVAAFARYWELDNDAALRLANIAVQRGQETSHARGLLSAHNALAILAIERLDADEAEHQLLQMGELTSNRQGFFWGAVVVTQAHAHRVRGDRARAARYLFAALEDGPTEDGNRVIPCAATVGAVAAELVESRTREVIDLCADAPVQVIGWVGIELIDGLAYQQAWETLRLVLEWLEEKVSESTSPRAELWARAGRAMLASVDDPGDAEAEAELERVRSIVDESGTGLLRVTLDGFLERDALRDGHASGSAGAASS
jgi:class 3 adenylate cyclase/tetratricopeptide (TPR) repeat protein